ncbi:MAG: GNAT family N-acetyltransferase, partial [Archaeoglobaceae archaeon]
WFSIFELKRVGEVHEIFILPEFRRRSVGSRLLSHAIDYALRNGRDVMELWVGEKNEIAKLFYARNGFMEAGKVGKWVRMVKKLEEL